ncbi:SAICAR synthase-like protein [Westerdykella ornata]|uniref:Kinase n=1 Tax=Westerdykella ornata TaxID=318751 RepID=A0A6A6JBK8_WESOR|nr:SAICAR synthase-like protein [Westerdykella ornata]KAF2273594.1 SAICAR synthase-like protein [Westerdykella ornata]
MSTKPFDPSSLQAFGHAAAGHDGVMSDASGAILVKPCTQAEVDFYQTVAQSHPNLQPHLPTFLGTLALAADDASKVPETPESGVVQTDNGVERLHGKKLDTELHIVLENITHGFKKPNVLDLKLGARLWDDDAKPEKRARLDEISASSTSGSLGFRIAGMRTYVGDKWEVARENEKFVEEDKEGFHVYNKMYGRNFKDAEDVKAGFLSFLLPRSRSREELERAREVATYFIDEIRDIQKVLESKESRMYSASLLLVYEGDINEYEKSKESLINKSGPEEKETEGEEEDADDEEEGPKLAVVKMIDFAHATFQPGQGPDENAIRGMRSAIAVFEGVSESVESLISECESGEH